MVSQRLRHLICLVVLAALAVPASALPASDRLELLAPGQPLPDISALPPAGDWLPRARWYALRLQDNRFFLQPVRAIRPPDWVVQHTSTLPPVEEDEGARPMVRAKPVSPAFVPEGVTLDIPADTLFALRVLRDDKPRPLPLDPQGYPSLLSEPVTLEDKWSRTVALAGQDWQLQTRSRRRPDGGLLAGSMALMMQSIGQAESMLVPPGHGMAFARQELLWLGDLDRDALPDALLRRVWITGEEDYVLSLGGRTATAYLDRDHPVSGFSSGVEESSSEWRHVSKVAEAPGDFQAAASFRLDWSLWSGANERIEAGLPFTLADRQVRLGAETVRFTIDYLPRAMPREGEFSSAADRLWEGPWLVRVTFRGRSQVLMQAHSPDEGAHGISVGMSNGQPAIHIDYNPHYNNSFNYSWRYSEEEQRFRRESVHQSQGC